MITRKTRGRRRARGFVAGLVAVMTAGMSLAGAQLEAPAAHAAAPPVHETREVIPAAAASATSQGCGYGSGAPFATGLCWLDFSGYSDAAATSAGGQQFEASVGGGYTLAYALSRIASPSDWGPWGSSATPIVYTDAFGTDAYTGVAGRPALYPGAPKEDDGVRVSVSLVLSDIRVTDAAGRPVSGYTLSIADAETLNDAERYTLSTNGSPWQVQGRLGAHPVCENGLTGVGTAALTCVGADSNTVEVGDLVASTAGGPTRIAVSSSVLHGREGFAFAIDTAQVTVTKRLPVRVSAGDQFAVGATDAAGTRVFSATTAGAAALASTGAVTVLAGAAYTLFDEAAAAGLAGVYTRAWSCTNAVSSATVLPSGSGASPPLVPAPADQIGCTVTNTALAPSELALTGRTAVPSSFARGHNTPLIGDVTSNYVLTNVTVRVVNTRTGKVVWSQATNPKTRNFDVAVWDTGHVFAVLDPDPYRFQITATDASGATRTLQDSAFTVTPPTQLALAAGTVFPTTAGYANAIKVGSTVQIQGDVFSNYRLTRVTATIATSAGKAKYTKTVNPAAYDFDLHRWQSALPTVKLTPGKYTFAVSAADASGRTATLQTTAFTVLTAAQAAGHASSNPASSQCSASGGVVGSSNEQKVWNWLIANGMSPVGAAGIMGNMQAESAFNPFRLEGDVDAAGLTTASNPATVGSPSGRAFGLAQWDAYNGSPARRGAVINYIISHNPPYKAEFRNLLKYKGDAGHTKAPATVNDGFIRLELEFLKAETPRLWAAVSTQTTPEGAARYWNKNYEVSADTSADRVKDAKVFYARHHGTSPQTCTGAAPAASAGAAASPAGSKNAQRVVATAISLSFSTRSAAINACNKIPTDHCVSPGGPQEYEQARTRYGTAPHLSDYNYGGDCGNFVATVMRASGADTQYPIGGTQSQQRYMSSSSLYVSIANNSNESNLKPGDIFVSGSHIFIYLGNNKVAQASMGTRMPHHDGPLYYTDFNQVKYQIFRLKG